MKMKKKKDNYLVKGEYTHPQIKGCLAAKQFIFIEQDGKHCLLLRFENEMRVPITEVEFTVTQLDYQGKEVGENIDVRYDDIRIDPKGRFCTDRGIVVDDSCADCIVRIKYVICEEIKYEVKNGHIVGHYDKRGYGNKRIKVKQRVIEKKNLKIKRKYAGGGGFYKFIAFVSLLLMVISLFAVKSGIENAEKNENFRNSRKKLEATDVSFEMIGAQENI